MGKHDGLMVSASGFGFEPDSDHCVVLVEMLFTYTVPHHPGVLLCTGDLNAGEG